jgi:hypothetical protein
VLDDPAVDHAGVSHGPTHHEAVRDRPGAIGEAHGACFLEQRHLGEVAAGAALGDGTIGIDLDALLEARAPRDKLDHRRIIDRRQGVGQAGEAGDAARGRGDRAARKRLLVLCTRLAELHAHVDQPRRQTGARRVDHHGIVRRRLAFEPARPEVDDPAVLDQKPAAGIQAARRVQQARAADERAPDHAAARSFRVITSRQAMRTATPSST